MYLLVVDGISKDRVRHGNIITIREDFEEVGKRGREFEKVRKKGGGVVLLNVFPAGDDTA